MLGDDPERADDDELDAFLRPEDNFEDCELVFRIETGEVGVLVAIREYTVIWTITLNQIINPLSSDMVYSNSVLSLIF